jgi:hypothetical protein
MFSYNVYFSYNSTTNKQVINMDDNPMEFGAIGVGINIISWNDETNQKSVECCMFHIKH